LLESLFTPVNQITDYIYLGNQTAAGYVPPYEDPATIQQKSSEAREKLQQLGIKHIVSCADAVKRFPEDFNYLVLDLKDKPLFPIHEYFDTAYQFIDDCVNKKEKVLLHCNAGVTRSATITLSYLMKKMNLSYDEAHKLVKSKRPCINVKNFEESLKGIKL